MHLMQGLPGKDGPVGRQGVSGTIVSSPQGFESLISCNPELRIIDFICLPVSDSSVVPNRDLLEHQEPPGALVLRANRENWVLR